MRVPWAVVWKENLTDSGAAFVHRGQFELPNVNLFATFRVIVSNFAGPNALFVRVRFTFGELPLATGAGQGFNLNNVNTNRSVLIQVPTDVVPGPFGIVGRAPCMLPPVGNVSTAVGVGTSCTLEIHACTFGVE